MSQQKGKNRWKQDFVKKFVRLKKKYMGFFRVFVYQGERKLGFYCEEEEKVMESQIGMRRAGYFYVKK